MQMSQHEWDKWSQQREADAPKVQKLYEKQAREVRAVIVERGCAHCNPIIVMAQGEHGGPSVSDPHTTHALDCPTNQ